MEAVSKSDFETASAFSPVYYMVNDSGTYSVPKREINVH
jgi:hypothetical protein